MQKAGKSLLTPALARTQNMNRPAAQRLSSNVPNEIHAAARIRSKRFAASKRVTRFDLTRRVIVAFQSILLLIAVSTFGHLMVLR